MATFHSTLTSSKPSETYDQFWISASAPTEILRKRGQTYGKWLIFRDNSEIDALWDEVSQAVESGILLATGAKVSTMRENPNSTNPDQSVTCVYTTIDDITLAGMYSNRGFKKTTMKTITWKDGKAIIK